MPSGVGALNAKPKSKRIPKPPRAAYRSTNKRVLVFAWFAARQHGLGCISPAPIDMPAVQLARLKLQIESLISFYTQPEDFHRQLLLLLEQHADLTFRSSPAVNALPPSVQSYHVPPLVIQQIERNLLHVVSKNPLPALALADLLWSDTQLETRLIAASLLGMLPSEHLDHSLQRIKLWARPDTDRHFLTLLFSKGAVNLRRFSPQRWLETIDRWISSADPAEQRLGILALQLLIEDRSFENLPAAFKIISPLLHEYHDLHRNDLRSLLTALSRRSPNETAYFLRQVLSLNTDPRLIKMVRQSLTEYPDEIRSRLREFLQALQR